MKRVFSIVLFVSLLMGLVGCGEQTTDKNAVSSIQDVQGFWYDENSSMLLGFKGDEYIIYGYGTKISITGTFDVDGQTITLYSDEYSDKVFESAKIENDILSYVVSETGETLSWKKISQAEVERMLLEDE